jgi:glycosyltransferase involved in cell wall biosynthesis
MSHIDVFIDLSGSGLGGQRLERFLERLTGPERLGSMIRRVTCIVAPGSVQERPVATYPAWSFKETHAAVDELPDAIAMAGRDLLPLLILSGPVDVSCEAIANLRQWLDRDPMFGFAVSRISCADACCLVRLSPHGVGATTWVSRRILPDLPETEVIAEIAAPCLLIRPEVLANFEPLERTFETVAAMMLQYMAAARRCGFRTVLCNRAVVKMEELTCAQENTQALSRMSDSDAAAIKKHNPDFERSWSEFRAGSWELFESLYGAVANGRGGALKRSLIVDVRNLGPLFNGTSHAIVNCLEALKDIRSGWEIAIYATAEGANFHDLAHRFDKFQLYTTLPDRGFTAALRPSQPWHIQEMLDLHRLSLFNVYLMLDTITWDVVYVAQPHFDGTWQFLADHADALLFDSDFSRQRFVERFPAGRSVPNAVTHFSFDPEEYVRTDVPRCQGDEEFILVIGNELDHKDVARTVETLTAAFPFRPIVVLGPTSTPSRFVTTLRSGLLPDIELHRLYACAKFVVFPSFYEGFGFPIVTALAYGRTVLARRSSLVEELAAHCVAHGRLLMFERRDELVDLVGRLVHGAPASDHPLGRALKNGAPRRWRDLAEEIMGFIEPLVGEPSRSRWVSREHALRQLFAFRG